MTTIREFLAQGIAQLAQVSESAAYDVRFLLCEVLKVDRAYLITHEDAVLEGEQLAQLQGWLARAAAGEPLPYIVGTWAFYDRDFIVTPDVLIPRPETELLLERALNFARERGGSITAADIGTGSGALSVTFAAHMPDSSVFAVDVSPRALAVARQNADRQGVQVTFFEGDLLTPIRDAAIKLELVMANLPYIPTETLTGLAVTAHEPRLALDGGADGLDLVRRLLAQLADVTHPRALVLLEIEASQGAAAVALARQVTGGEVALYQDYAGHDRIVSIMMP